MSVFPTEDGGLARIAQQNPTVPVGDRPHGEVRVRGLVATLERIEGITPAGVLSQPFHFQVAPLNTFAINRSYPQTVWDTVGRKQASRSGVTQLRAISYDTLFTADPWWWTQLHGDGYVPNPNEMLSRLENLGEDGVYFWLTVRNPARYDYYDVNWAAALVNLNTEIREGEPDDKYVTVGFQEYRDASLKARSMPGSGTKNSKLPVKLRADQLPANRNTLHELAIFYYGSASEWRRIAKANNLGSLNPSADLRKLGHRKITVPRKP